MKYLFTITMLFVAQFASAYDFYTNGIYYNITSQADLTVEVTYREVEDIGMIAREYVYKCSYGGNVTIPSYVTYNNKKYKVTRIGDYAFATTNYSNYASYQQRLKSITLPETIESVGKLAFWQCQGLTSVVIPSSVKELGDYIFAGSENIRAYYVLCSTPPESKYGTNLSPFGYPPGQTCDIIVPQKAIYMANKIWSQYGTRIKEMVTPTKMDFTYTGKNPDISITNNIQNLTMDIKEIRIDKNAGNHTAIVKIEYSESGTEKFTVDIPIDYTINKATLSINIPPTSREYGENNPTFTYKSITGFVNGENESNLDNKPELTCKATKFSQIGNYPITASLNDKNYKLDGTEGVMTITKAPLHAKVNDTSRTYGSNFSSFTLCYQGLKNGEKNPAWQVQPQFTTTATIKSDVGTYDINANATALNYELSPIESGVLTITPASLYLNANNKSRLYFDEEPNFTYSTSGFKNGDDISVFITQPVISTNATRTSPVGKYDITIDGASALNYQIYNQKGVLTINKRELYVSAEDCVRPYNEDNPQFKLLYEGFVNNEDESALEIKPTISTKATKTSKVGTYPINVGGGSANNYSFSYKSGILTIEKANQAIEWNQNLEGIAVGSQVELNAVASSGLNITYISGDESIASIYKAGDKYYIDCLKEGNVQIRAFQEGNYNYNATIRVAKTLSIYTTNGITTITFGENNPNKEESFYNITGQKISSTYKGLIVRNGKKYYQNR